MYYIILFVLVIFSFIDFLWKKQNNFIYILLMGIMTGVLCLRYGQGTDYFGYYYLYSLAPIHDIDISFYKSDIHVEVGYKALMNLFSFFNLDFEVMIFIISLLMMFLLYRTLSIHLRKYKIFALLLFYDTYYLTYFASGIRQGIELAFFLGIMLGCLHEKKYKKYYLMCLILISIHSASIILLVLPIINKINLKKMILFTPFSLLLGIIFMFPPISSLFASIIGRSSLIVSVSYLGILLRIFMLLIILILYLNSKKDCDFTKMLMKIYVFGFIVAMILSPFELISQRLTMPMKALEVLLIPLILQSLQFNFNVNKLKLITFLTMVSLSSIMTFKNIYGYMDQGGYYNVSLLNYPYISVFNKEDAFEYRDITSQVRSVVDN